MAPRAMPSMAVGTNRFTYLEHTDNQTGANPARHLRITHTWVERSKTRPPKAPEAPVYPANGGESDGTDVVFQWKAAADPDGDAITDHHFQLSDRPDLRWPLSPNFDKYISKTPDQGKTSYTLPRPGLLTHGQTYYVEAPRPFIYSAPVTSAPAGQPYRYQVKAIRSLGDLTRRDAAKPKPGAKFWKIEPLQFALTQKPNWMSIDADTGLITGTSDGTGGVVTVSVTLTKEHRLVHDKDNIVWGNEYEQSQTYESVGPVIQRFAVEPPPASFPKKGKTTGVALVDGVFYATVNLEDGTWPDVNHTLAWSTTPKWMSADGLTLWSIFSVYGAGAERGLNAHDRFNLVKACLQLPAP